MDWLRCNQPSDDKKPITVMKSKKLKLTFFCHSCSFISSHFKSCPSNPSPSRLPLFSSQQIISLSDRQKKKVSVRSAERHNTGSMTGILPLVYTCVLYVRELFVCLCASFICWTSSALPPCQFSRPTQPPTHLHNTHTKLRRNRGKKFSYLDGGDRCGWRAVQGSRERRGRKHKEKAWLVCEFSTCNLSYSELSCFLLFGSNRLMPGVCLNKSTMLSSG